MYELDITFPPSGAAVSATFTAESTGHVPTKLVSYKTIFTLFNALGGIIATIDATGAGGSAQFQNIDPQTDCRVQAQLWKYETGQPDTVMASDVVDEITIIEGDGGIVIEEV